MEDKKRASYNFLFCKRGIKGSFSLCDCSWVIIIMVAMLACCKYSQKILGCHVNTFLFCSSGEHIVAED